MSLLVFGGVCLGIVLFAVAVNRLTGTRARYLDALQFEAGERALWRDAEADFATVPRMGQTAVMAFPRLRRHTVLWTDHRVIVAQKPLWSSRRMITYEIYFVAPSRVPSNEQQIANEVFGGFYGRGYVTIAAVERAFGEIGGKPCLRITPAADCGASLNLAEAVLFSDRLDELRLLLAAQLAGASINRAA